MRWLNGTLLLDDGAAEVETEVDRLQPEGVNALDGAMVVQVGLGRTPSSDQATQIQAKSAAELAAKVDTLVERLRGEVQFNVWLVPDDPGWSGVLLEESEVGRRTRDLTALFEYVGSIGPKHWWSRLVRKNAERWGEEMVERVRAGMLEPPEHSALRVIALHRDLNGELLSSRVAAVELLNVLRPTIAVAVFIVFSALALHQYSACWQKLEAGENGYAELFVQEVRRFYPSSLRRSASAARFRMERLLISPGQAGDPGFVWYQPRSTDVGRARSVSAGAIP